tara:strand:- start:203 stop:1330 length:1128 start_codon:yes stop_codon:yes gene_type:complete
MYYKGHTLYYFCYENWSFKKYKPGENNNSKINKTPSLLSFIYRLKYFLKRLIYIIPMFGDLIIFIKYYLLSKLMRNQLIKIEPDIVHAHYVSSNAIYAYLSKFRPLFLTLWGSDIRSDSMTKYQRKLFIQALNNANFVTSGSKELLNISQSMGVKNNNCYNITMPGIDISHFEKTKVPKEFYKKMGIPLKSKIIFSPRGMNSLYRIEKIVEAFASVSEKYNDVFLILLDYNTDEEYLDKVIKLIESKSLKNSVKLFLNMPNPFLDMNLLYAMSFVAISIPESDGMPQSMFESFASECPLISSNLSTYDEILTHNFSGIRVSGTDSDEISKAIIKLLDDEKFALKIVKNAKKIVAEKGDINVATDKMENLYYKSIK